MEFRGKIVVGGPIRNGFCENFRSQFSKQFSHFKKSVLKYS